MKNLEEVLRAAGNPVDAAQLADRRLRLSGGAERILQLARRAARLAEKRGAVRPVAPHGRAVRRGPRRAEALLQPRRNSFANFPVDRAKQFAPTNYDGYVIGDGILFHLAQESLVFVGRAPAASWIQFHAETGGYNVVTRKDDRSPGNTKGNAIVRRNYRFQIQGPNAWKVIEAERRPGARNQVLQHGADQDRRPQGARAAPWHGGRAGPRDLGPYAEREEMRAAIVAAGREFGLKEVGARAYATNTLESGWIPSPLPAVYTGEKMKKYREWLPATSYEATGSIGGSFYSKNIEDYYVTPYEMGYGPFIKFDHDFIGRQALKMAGKPHRKKVTFAWNADDVAKVWRSMLEPGDPYKYIDLPLSNSPRPRTTRSLAGGKVGLNMFSGYSYNERSMLSLGIVDPDIELGTELKLLWGEEGGGSKKTTVERHRQIEIRVVVSPVPYAKQAHPYAEGWRTKATV